MHKLDKSNECLECGEVLDMATSVEGDNAIPTPGDVTVCIRCGTIAQFTEEMNLKPITSEMEEDFKEQNPEGWKLMIQASQHIKKYSDYDQSGEA